MANITITHPEIAKQWHPTKNGDLRAENFTYGSDKTVWWLCPKKCKEGCLHEYEMTIYSKIKGSNCKFCCKPRKQYCIHETIIYTHPEIAKQWHPTKNGDLKPQQFTFGSHKKVWWLCEKTCTEGCKHEWESFINRRTGLSKLCPFCCTPQQRYCEHKTNITLTHHEISKQWHPTKNGDLKPEQFTSGSGILVWWLCEKTCPEGCKHEWESIIQNRTTHNQGCPFCCLPKKSTCIHESLTYSHPEIAKQWHPTKNGDLKPQQFTFGSHKKVWWLCEKTCPEGCNHEWDTSIYQRCGQNTGCPYCYGRVVCIHNSIKYTHPEIAKQWHPTKNGDLISEKFSFGSDKQIWWINLECKHEWLSNINNRCAKNSGCPFCVNKTEQKLYDTLILHYPQLKPQFKVDWCMNVKHLPYDFVLAEDKIIIELDGLQHFEQVSNWQAPEETHLNDVYKMKCAKNNGYSIIRLLQTDVFYDTYDWLKDLRANIEKIRLEQRVQNVYMCKDNEYAIFNT
jgi:very-short-patch-repair endonuclease